MQFPPVLTKGMTKKMCRTVDANQTKITVCPLGLRSQPEKLNLSSKTRRSQFLVKKANVCIKK